MLETPIKQRPQCKKSLRKAPIPAISMTRAGQDSQKVGEEGQKWLLQLKMLTRTRYNETAFDLLTI